MAQTSYTPIQLYYSTTAAAVPLNTNLASGELAINITDGLLFYKDNGGTVQKIGYKLTPTTAGGTGLTSFTNGGIVYASSTSALSTGSALVFDGTNLGLGVTPSAWSTFKVLEFPGGIHMGAYTGSNNVFLGGNCYFNGSSWIYKATGAAARHQINAFDGSFYWYSAASGTAGSAITFSTPMLLDASGNLGIGTSSPAAKLESFITSTSTPALRLRYNSSSYYADHLMDGNGNYVIKAPTANGVTSGNVLLQAGGSLYLYTNNAEAARIDSSGNLGLGVTPSAWNSVYRAVQIGLASCISGRTDQAETQIVSNAFRTSTGAYKYISTDFASRIELGSGAVYFFNAPSGTAGNAITFTQAMTLDASGRLGIGTTTPDRKLTLLVSPSTAGDDGYKISDGTRASTFARTGATYSYQGVGVNSTLLYSSNTLCLLADGSSVLSFHNGNGETARIDSSGNLLVGATSNPAGVRLVIGGTSSSARVEPATDNVGYIGEGTYRWQAVYAVNGTIQTSDGREKNTIEDSNLGLSFVNALRPVSYKWNVGENVVTYDEEGKEVVTPRAGVRVHYGFIAQEVKAVIPKGVDFGGFVQEPDEGRMSLRYHEFIGPLVKAIQEQQALITTLTDRITALEGA
jgi:hypothetical protein